MSDKLISDEAYDIYREIMDLFKKTSLPVEKAHEAVCMTLAHVCDLYQDEYKALIASMEATKVIMDKKNHMRDGTCCGCGEPLEDEEE